MDNRKNRKPTRRETKARNELVRLSALVPGPSITAQSVPRCETTRKAGYRTKAEADLHMLKISGRESLDGTGRKPVRSYECQFCGHWHLTSQLLKTHAPARVSAPARSVPTVAPSPAGVAAMMSRIAQAAH